MAPIEKETIELEKADDFLIEAANQVHELVVLRTRVANAKREHAELLARREAALGEGIDLLPQVRKLFLEIEKLPGEIEQLEQRGRGIVTQGVERLNAENRERAAAAYRIGRDNLREALQRFRSALADIWESAQRSAECGESSTGPFNARLEEIQKALGVGTLPRVEFRPLILPSIEGAFANRYELLRAMDGLISGLR